MLKFCQLSKTFILLFCSIFMNMVYADVNNWQMNMFKGSLLLVVIFINYT